jgi:plasmid stabilization system protein ParE
VSWFAVLLTPRATRELDQARADGRTLAVDEEVAEAFRRLEAFPQMGARVRLRGKWSTTVRRVLLDRSGYHLYYRVRLEANMIVVLCVWYERRRAPRL